MANYRINSASSSSSRLTTEQENFPREGLVNDVCKGWLLHEDQALAYRLQSEEYQHHLGSNKEKNAILRQDTPKAKEEQYKEDEEAAKTRNEIEIALAEQEARDAALAEKIALALERQEREEHRQQEMRDAALAKSLMEQEKARVRHLKEIRQVEREAAYLGINSGLDNVAILSRKDKRNVKAKSSSEDLSDLSDFCIQPSPSMDEEEQRRLQEEQDEELARLMQEQDLKRRGDLLREDQLMAIEAQDKELAKVLQEQEKAKAKKAREKARQKGILKKQQKRNRSQEDEDIHNSSFDRSAHSESPECSHYASIEHPDTSPQSPQSPRAPSPPPNRRPSSPQYATPVLQPRQMELGTSTISNYQGRGGGYPERPYTQEQPRQATSECFFRDEEYTAGLSRFTQPNYDGRRYECGEKTPKKYPQQLSCQSPSYENVTHTPPRAFPNIACAIDPTYERRMKSGEFAHPGSASVVSPVSSYSKESRNSSSPVYPLEPTFSVQPQNTDGSVSPASPLASPVFEDDDDYLPPPYMPIQGQRRTASLEKGKGALKFPKEKVNKDGGCKQQ